MNITALKAELDAGHPDTGPYDVDDVAAAYQLNAINRTRNRTDMTGREVAAEIVNGEYDALTDVKKAQLLALTAHVDIDPFGFAANVVKSIFGAGSATLAALAVARVEEISRAAELGLGLVTAGDIQRARA